MSSLAWFYDVFAIGLVLAMLYIGAKKGFVKTVLILVSYIVALVGGYLIADPMSVAIYDKFVADKAYELVDENYEKIDVNSLIKNQIQAQGYDIEIDDEALDETLTKGGDLYENLSDFLAQCGVEESAQNVKEEILSEIDAKKIMQTFGDSVPSEVISIVNNVADTSKENVTEIVTVLANGDKQEGVEVIMDKLVDPVVKGVIKLVIWIIAFFILMIIATILVNIISGTIKFVPLVGSLNTVLGAILGALEGILILVVICVVIKLAIVLTSGDVMFINEETINETKLFKLIYNLKYLK